MSPNRLHFTFLGQRYDVPLSCEFRRRDEDVIAAVNQRLKTTFTYERFIVALEYHGLPEHPFDVCSDKDYVLHMLPLTPETTVTPVPCPRSVSPSERFDWVPGAPMKMRACVLYDDNSCA